MKNIISFIILILFSIEFLFSQKHLSKDEILYYYKNGINKSLEKDSLKIISFNNNLELLIKKTIDSLSNKNIDTLIIFTESHPGYYGIRDECISLLYPINIYIIWKSNNYYFEKRIINGCEKGNVKSLSSPAFNYYINNMTDISNQFIMPVIKSAVMKKDSTITYSLESVDHEPNYLIYLKSGNKHSRKIFSENDLSNKESLFYEYNLNLKIYKLFKIINDKIKE